MFTAPLFEPVLTTMRIFALALLCSALCACATAGQVQQRPEPFCRVGSLAFHTDFETASLHGCAQGESGPVLTIAPEYAPINPSPWYAWRITAAASPSANPEEITLTQRYLYGRHRYHPWTSVDGKHWERLVDSRVDQADDGSVTLRLAVPDEGLHVAAQPPLSDTDMTAWAMDLASANGLRIVTVAESVGGRALIAIESETSRRRGSLVLIGRQHPPETTGGLAYQDFVRRVFADDDLAKRFRGHFAVGLLPEVNPDGVVRGHWRGNQRGVDLNRDWGPFTQPETRGVADWMADLHRRAPLQLFMDFHSTWSDVFYMPHPADELYPSGFGRTWRARLAQRLGESMPRWSGEHNPGLPTAKSWVRRHYGVLAMTYEVGDNTPHERIQRVAEAAAEEMMKLMLEYEDGS